MSHTYSPVIGGRVSFNDKVNEIKKSLIGKPVPRKYKKEYGDVYTDETAAEVATKIAGAIKRDEYAKGGPVEDWHKKILPLQYISGAICAVNGQTVVEMNREAGATPLSPAERDEMANEIISLYNKKYTGSARQKKNEFWAGGQPISSGDVTQPVFESGGIAEGEIEQYVKELNERLVKDNQAALLDEANKKLSGHGIEFISDGRAGAAYVNMGDTYTLTVLLDLNEEEFIATSWGDWYESTDAYKKMNLYVVDSYEERGEWTIDVTSAETDNSVWDYRFDGSAEDTESSLIDDGFMKNIDDVDGLEKYLKDVNILHEEDVLISRKEYEQKFAKGGKMKNAPEYHKEKILDKDSKMNTTFLTNRGAKIIEKNAKTQSVHAVFSKLNEETKEKVFNEISLKFKKVSRLPSAFDDDLSLLIFLK